MKAGKLKRGDEGEDDEEQETKTSYSRRSMHRDPHYESYSSSSSRRANAGSSHEHARHDPESNSTNNSRSHRSKRRKLKSSGNNAHSTSNSTSNSNARSTKRSHRSSRDVASSRSAASRPTEQPQRPSDQFDDSVVTRLLGLISDYFEEGSSEADVDPRMVHQLLEASSGNVDLAATFFWDQYVASGIHRQQQNEAQRDSPAEKKRGPGLDLDLPDEEDDEDDVRPLRRSLLGRFDESAPQRARRPGDDDEDDDDDDDDDHYHHNADNHHDQEDDEDDDDDVIVGHQVNDQEQPPLQPQPAAVNAVQVDPEQVANPPRIPAVARIAHVEALVEDEVGDAINVDIEADDAAAIAGSVSVSDDEGGGIWRMERRRRQAIDEDAEVHRNIGIQQDDNDNGNPGADVGRPGRAAAAIGVAAAGLRRHVSVSDRVEQQIPPNDDGDANVPDADRAPPDVPMEEVQDDNDDEAYLSDGDWLTSSPRTTSTPPPLPPLSVLWGAPPSTPDTIQDDPANVEDEEEEPDTSPKTTTIPRTWLHATFSMSPDGGGLVVKPPSEDDVAIFRWKQQQSGGGNDIRNFILPPHHCKSVTAIIAVVNATLLTGASMQGNRVDCSSGKTPFAELTGPERVKQFESRLADALAALLFVALKASTARKTKALDAREKLAASKKNKNKQRDVADFFKMQKQQVARKLRLCPTCRWQDDATSGEPRLPEARSASRVRIVTSFTNISDLRSYVKSNMQSFTGRGGCALLLETIVRIHGKSTVERLVRNSRRKLGLPVDPTKKGDGLIACTCHDRHCTVRPPRQAGAPANTPILDTTPPGHECLSVELLSLLICGEVHSTFKGWSKENALGFGVLSNIAGEVGAQLKHPRKPVWILRGATSHTVAWIDPVKMPLFDMTHLDQSGTVLQLCHWNFWYGQRNLSRMRLITARGKWAPPGLSSSSSSNGPYVKKYGKVVERIIQEKQQERQLASIVSADEQEDDGKTSNAISETELSHVFVNPDDEKFYPKQYRRWRYKFSEAASDGWLGHHSLSERQRLIVEVKLAPKINAILWSRWPNSIIDKFIPSDESLPIV